MGKYNYLKPTKERHIFNMTRKGIGTNLYLLSMIKKYPDNYTENARKRAIESLKIAMHGYHRMLKENPALKGAKQLDLFKENK